MQKDLTNGSIVGNVLRFSIPFFISSFLQTMYGIVDLFIIGQFNGADTIAAVSSGGQIMHMVTVVIIGLAMGTTILLSRAVGAKDEKRIANIIGNTVILFLIVSILLTSALIVFNSSLVKWIQTPVESVEQTKSYLLICFIGIPFIVAYNVISSVFRGLGDTKSPMYFIAAAGVVNIILDYILIGKLGMGAAGAALGTALSQTFSVVFSLLYIKKKSLGITVKRKDFALQQKMAKELLRIGAPIAVQDGLIQVSFLIITAIANGRGVDVAAAVGIVEKIIGFLFLVPSAMSSAVSAISAQNVGANLHGRAKKTLWYACGITFGVGMVFSILCQWVSPRVVGWFTDEPLIIQLGAQYLRAYVFDCAIAGIHFCFSGYFCAYQYAYLSFLHNIASIILMRIPGAYFASVWFPETLFPMGMAAPLGSLLSVMICYGMYLWLRKRQGRNYS